MRGQPRLSLIERALVEQKWHATAMSAHIQALLGDNSDGMVHDAGTVFYVVLGACLTEQVDPEMPEIRVIRGAVNAVHDQAGESCIPAQRRQSILVGLEAAERLVGALPRSSLISAACDLVLKKKSQHIHYSDFEALIKGQTT